VELVEANDDVLTGGAWKEQDAGAGFVSGGRWTVGELIYVSSLVGGGSRI
jgi:hypothetical protein